MNDTKWEEGTTDVVIRFPGLDFKTPRFMKFVGENPLLDDPAKDAARKPGVEPCFIPVALATCDAIAVHLPQLVMNSPINIYKTRRTGQCRCLDSTSRS